MGHDLDRIQGDPLFFKTRTSGCCSSAFFFFHFHYRPCCYVCPDLWDVTMLLDAAQWHPLTPSYKSYTFPPRFRSKLECCWSCDWHSLTRLLRRPMNLSVPAEILPTPWRHCWMSTKTGRDLTDGGVRLKNSPFVYRAEVPFGLDSWVIERWSCCCLMALDTKPHLQDTSGLFCMHS